MGEKNSIFIRLYKPNCQTESTNIDEPLCLAGSCQLVGCGWRMCVEEERNGENSEEEEKNETTLMSPKGGGQSPKTSRERVGVLAGLELVW